VIAAQHLFNDFFRRIAVQRLTHQVSGNPVFVNQPSLPGITLCE